MPRDQRATGSAFPRPMKNDLILSPASPLKSARKYVEVECTRDGLRTIQHQAGSFYVWDGTHYPEADNATIRAAIYKFLESARLPAVLPKEGEKPQPPGPFHPNISKVANVIDALGAVANLPAQQRSPLWLDGRGAPAATEIIACKNGLLHLPTRQLMSHTPAFYTHNALNFDYEPDAAPPSEWFRFLGALWGDDDKAKDTIATLQEIFGYLLTGDTQQQKAFLIVGPKRSGKGTIARILTRLVGAENVAGPTLASLGQNFGLAPLIGKRVAIISDARLGSHVDQHAIAERLLSISGEDALTIDRKHRSAWTGRLETRFLILSNELPRLADASGALTSRFILLVMTESFFGREDHALEMKLSAELPGILNWSIDGWQALQRRGYFVQPESGKESLAELEDLSSPISAFLRECCEIGAGKKVIIGELYSAWGAWCAEQGRAHQGTRQSFGRDLRAAVPGLRSTNPRDNTSGKRTWSYEGIALRKDAPKANGHAATYDAAARAAEEGPPEDFERERPVRDAE